MSWKQLRPFFMPGAVEQITNDIHTLELYQQASGKFEIRFEMPDGTSAWGKVDDGLLSGEDLYKVPAYVKARAKTLWNDMSPIMS